MNTKTKRITAAAVICGGLGLGAAAIASAGGDSHEPIQGAAYQRATSIALAQTHGGHVTETEQGDEESFYQVEVTNPNGTQTDVNLDRAFRVVGVKTEAADSHNDGQNEQGDGRGEHGNGRNDSDRGRRHHERNRR